VYGVLYVHRKGGPMSSSSKRQQTAAKRNREQLVKERRALKLQRKHDKKLGLTPESPESLEEADGAAEIETTHQEASSSTA
jgi:hypothetical protein